MDDFPAKRMLTAFLSLTSYSHLDMLAANYTTRIFMTKNGGQYQLSEDLKKVKRLAGPPWQVEDRGHSL